MKSHKNSHFSEDVGEDFDYKKNRNGRKRHNGGEERRKHKRDDYPRQSRRMSDGRYEDDFDEH